MAKRYFTAVWLVVLFSSMTLVQFLVVDGTQEQVDSKLEIEELPEGIMIRSGYEVNKTRIVDQPFVNIFEVRDSNGVTIFLELRSSQSGSAALWTPEQPGDYDIRTFAITSLASPQILSPVQKSSVTVTEQPDLSTGRPVQEYGDGCVMPSECEEPVIVQELTEQNFTEYRNPEPVNPVDDGVTVVGELPVEMSGSLEAECRDEIGAAWLLLHENDSSSYDYALDHVTGIRCEPSNSHVNVISGVFQIGQKKWKEPVEYLASTLIHEACHIAQWKAGEIPVGEEAEVECITEELQVLNNFGIEDPWKRRMIEDPDFRRLPENRYWEGPLKGTY